MNLFPKHLFKHKNICAYDWKTGMSAPTDATTGSLNDELSGLVFNQTLYEYTSIFKGFLISDGAKYVADKYNLYRFMDTICAYQVLAGMPPFQVWELNRYTYHFFMLPDIITSKQPCKLTCYGKSSFLATCTDANHTLLQKQFITHYEFTKPHVKVLLVGNVIMLPAEYS